jgi:hypothetical protein
VFPLLQVKVTVEEVKLDPGAGDRICAAPGAGVGVGAIEGVGEGLELGVGVAVGVGVAKPLEVSYVYFRRVQEWLIWE